ncbi:MAG: hypothetical protein WBZ36_15970 [Candidatus Nitrosopolaris sp.]
MNKSISKNRKQNSNTNNKDKPKQCYQQNTRLHGSQHNDREENLTQKAWQKQRESEQLKVNPEEILEVEEKRTNPICIEESM